MKARVLRAYIDKDTKQSHKIGETVDIATERFELLKTRGFVDDATADDKNSKAEVAALKKENAALAKENAELKVQITELKTIIEKAATKE